MSYSGRLSQLAAVAMMMAASSIPDGIQPYASNTSPSHSNNDSNASPEEIAAIREETQRRKTLNFRKRLPKGHPDRIES